MPSADVQLTLMKGYFFSKAFTMTGMDFSSNAGETLNLLSFLAPSKICALVSVTDSFFIWLTACGPGTTAAHNIPTITEKTTLLPLAIDLLSFCIGCGRQTRRCPSDFHIGNRQPIETIVASSLLLGGKPYLPIKKVNN